ncbi:MAG: endonuclease/exonuclease/phosphatase family protein [Bacteroidales bacterium]|mgnify:FL=1|nr:endonuclease/exonuclease/phosphatase family protein [Bacteroidales bacterium]
MRKLLLIPLTLALIATACSVKPSSAPVTEDTIKIMSFNVRMSFGEDGSNSWVYRKEAVAKVIKEMNPVLLGLQEACPEQLHYLDSALVNYRHIGRGRDDGRADGEMMAIYFDTTKVVLLNNSTFWLSETPNEVSRGWDAACNRTCEWGEFKLKSSGKNLVYFNTHLDHVGKVARENSIKLLVEKAEAFADNSLPWLISADFNSKTDDAIFNPLKAFAKDARATSQVSDSIDTYNGFGNEASLAVGDNLIDHIFYRDIEPLEFVTHNESYGVPFVSDHYPITFKFVVK